MAPRRSQRRRGNKGDGSVVNTPKGSDRWFFRPPPVGGQQQPLIRARDETHAHELKAQHRRDREDGIAGGRAYTVRSWMPVYCQAALDQGTAKDSTIEGYEQKDRLYISAHLGDILLSDLTTARVRKWFARDLVGKEGQLLAFATRKNTFALLNAALNLAVVEALIRRNPCDGVKIVRPEGEDEYRGYALAPAETERLLAAARDHWLYAIIYTALATGMRLCELIGLRWNNVVLNGPRPRIIVAEQYKVVRGKGRWQSVKNRKRREIDIDDDLAAVLSAQWERVQARRHDPAAKWTKVDHNLVFPSLVGTPLNDRNLVRAYKAMLQRAQLPDCTFHDLRHTAGSLMLMAGARYAEVSEVLGHSSVKVTQDIYAHAFPETRREAVAGLGRLLRRTGGA
jgi:integrase